MGWALGVDRVLELIKEQGLGVVEPVLDAYAIVTDAVSLPLVLQMLQTLRALGISVQMHTSTDSAMSSMKSQFKRADTSKAKYALIFGADEVSNRTVTVKPLRAGGGEQVTRFLSDVSEWALTLQSSN